MSAENSANASGAAARLAAANARPAAPIYITVSCLVIIFALVLGVGLASNLVLRHIVQTAPLWIAVVLGLRRSRGTSWVGLPFFLFWLAIMVLIWLYLLGISNVVSGHFSPVEITMTLIVGAASIVGIASFIRHKPLLSLAGKVSLFVIAAVLQWVCFRVSFLPAIVHR